VSELPVRPYAHRPAAVEPWDPRCTDVARELARLIGGVLPGVVAHHVGSSAVPGLAGANVVDLAVEAEPDAIPLIAEAMLSLGFGRETGLAPFPPTRPLLLGAVLHEGVPCRVHLHVMPPARDELRELLGFRDALRADAALRDAYADAKRAIVHKGDFVEDVLLRLGIRRPPADRPLPLPPGSTIGVLGGGQLGRMMGFAARAMGYRLIALDPDPLCPTAAVADEIIVGRYDDVEAARRLGAMSDVVTYELEHVGLDAAAAARDGAPLRPGLAALAATQDRLAERRFIRAIGEWTAPWREVSGVAEAEAAARELGLPMRLKSPVGGYDGRSQVRVVGAGDVAAGVAALGGLDGRPLLAEAEINFEAELSVVCARDRDGRTLAFPISRNVHDEAVLAETVAPAPVDPLVAAAACSIASSVARGLDAIGVITVELFQLRGGGLMINELAPRVHNSGHWTIEGAATSQFEQHLRAILGLPLGSAAPHGSAAMVNLLGTGPDRPAILGGLDDALADPRVHVHVYGKRRVFDRRKMGHITVAGVDDDSALERARQARAALHWKD
jgi:5-(carboxyamino)imidazole ribonucleotide synthase